MGLIEYLDKLVVEHGSAVVMEKHLAFIRAQAAALEKKVSELEAANSGLEKQVSHLKSELAAKTRLEEFAEHEGALFKRKPDGSYHAAVYCPRCKIAAGTTGSIIHRSVIPYSCGCGWVSGFPASRLDTILKELP
jgi:hypothetical protein